MGYSVNTPGYRVWDPVSHKVWDIRGLDFDELVGGGWWKKPPVALKPKWEEDAPLNLMEGLDLEEEPPAVEAPPTPDDDHADGGADVVAAGGGSPGGGSPGGGSPGVGSSGCGGPLSDVDEDDPPQIEGVHVPRMSGRERRGVPPLRLIEIMAAAANVEDGGTSQLRGCSQRVRERGMEEGLCSRGKISRRQQGLHCR